MGCYDNFLLNVVGDDVGSRFFREGYLWVFIGLVVFLWKVIIMRVVYLEKVGGWLLLGDFGGVIFLWYFSFESYVGLLDCFVFSIVGF